MKKPEALRIIDANFNRVREALRVIEDICRFSAIEKDLQIKLREIRHYFAISYIKYFDLLPIMKRDVASDAGRKNLPHIAKTLREILLRNFLRIEEGFRCIEECSAVVCPESVSVWQKLRFSIYEIEQQILLKFPEKTIGIPFLGVYLPETNIKQLMMVTKSIITSQPNILIFQPQENSIRLIKYLKKIKPKETIILIVNRPDIALITDIDGIYLTQIAMKPEDIRTFMPERIIGVEIKSMKDAKRIDETKVDLAAVENPKISKYFLTKPAKKSKLLIAGITHSHQEIINYLKNGANGVILKLNMAGPEQIARIIDRAKKTIKDSYYGKETRTPEG